MHYVWVSFGLLSLALGVIGVVLPLLPTVPFLLLAAFCFARSSERLHNWLLSHPRFGPIILDWHQRGAISLPAKRVATLSIVIIGGLSAALGFSHKILIIQYVVLSLVLIFIWTRPSS